ncbi:hypothetical protein KAI87_04020, partial [Myxococcota bacterium]|nr:hypothetical protein [Myxococcota bacterium]
MNERIEILTSFRFWVSLSFFFVSVLSFSGCSSRYPDNKPPEPTDSCINNIQDIYETDTDCGGPDCDGCAEDKECLGGSDCLSGHCLFGICFADYCGDESLNGDEECDDGSNGDPCDGCLDDCTFHISVCGDGFLCGDEQCDDAANGNNCDGCLDDCTLHALVCGDGFLCGAEQCDDAAN